MHSESHANSQSVACSGCKTEAQAFSLKRSLWRLGLGLALFLVAIVLRQSQMLSIGFYVIAYLIFGYDVLQQAVQKLWSRQVFDEHFLMSLATMGALIIGEYPEAVAVMLFYQVGEFFQQKAVAHSRRSIEKLQQIRPDKARRLQNGRWVTIDPQDVVAGDELVILAGERVPVDGIILKGYTSMDTSAMTGESLPQDQAPGDEVLAGFINQGGKITLRARRAASDSAVSRILDLVMQSSLRKAKTERFISRFARVYTPIVVGLALLTAAVPPLALGQPIHDWVYRALILLVISCPCALVLSVPLSYFAGLGAASRLGLLVKGGHILERLADIRSIVLDKTGTVTQGVFAVSEVESEHHEPERVMQLAAIAEMHSTHPIARSIIEAYKNEGGTLPDGSLILSHEDLPGLGVQVRLKDQEILLGNRKLMQNEKVIGLPKPAKDGRARLHVSCNGQFIGSLVLTDQAKPKASEAIDRLRRLGIDRIILLSGDQNEIVSTMAKSLRLDEAYGEKMPEQKLTILERILKRDEGPVAYLGDGINDAPALTRADLGIAMGGGSDAAIESADAVLMSGKLENLPSLIEIARKTKRIVTQNVVLVLGLKVLIMSLAFFGLSGIWQAIFADVGVSLLAVFNALRIARR